MASNTTLTLSPVWAFFKKPDDPSDARGKSLLSSGNSVDCLLCGSPVKRKCGSTSNMFQHIERHHPKEYTTIDPTQLRKSVKQSKPVSNQKTLTEFQIYDKNSKRYKDITAAITYFLCKDGLPMYTVEKEGFKHLLNVLDNRYKAPGRKYFSGKAIPARYSEEKQKTKEILVNEVSYFSATSDGWTSVGMDPYLSLSIHFISREFELVSRNLETSYMPDDATGENIARAITGFFDKWGMNKEQVVSITTDSASSMKLAIGLLGVNRVSCFGHILHNAVVKSLQDDKINRAVSACRRVVRLFSYSYKKKKALTNAQIALNLKPHPLKIDTKTRWGSCYNMIKRVLENEQVLRNVLGEDPTDKQCIPSRQQFDVMESVQKALSPISELTDLLSGENYVTVSSTIPIIQHLIDICSPTEDDTLLTNKIRESVKQYVLLQ